jgi:hypothetical protein
MERRSSHAAWSNAYHYISITVHPYISFVAFQTPRITLIKFPEFKTCIAPSSVLYVVKFYCFIKYKSRQCMLTLGSAPCGRNVYDRFVIGKKISNKFLGFGDSKSKIVIQDISTESKKCDYTNLFYRYRVILLARDSSVGIATRYGLGGSRIESR